MINHTFFLDLSNFDKPFGQRLFVENLQVR